MGGVAFGLAFSVRAFEPQSKTVVQHQYEGSLGESRIGMTIVRDGNQIEGGHYFYQKFLRDIPLTGSMKDSQITLQEAGGTFHLHFVGNGSSGARPLDFENSIGMEGAWTSSDGRRTYPVSLRGMSIRSGPENERRYADVTRESDAEFEHRVQSLLRAVLSGDKSAAVRFISYPLAANLPNGRGTRRFRNPAEVLAAWNVLFTPALLAQLRNDLPHDMFVHNGMAMFGEGEAWFDGKGLSAVNVPASGK